MKLNVNLPHHPYDILIEKGSLSQAGSWLGQLWQPQKVVIVTLCGKGQTELGSGWV